MITFGEDIISLEKDLSACGAVQSTKQLKKGAFTRSRSADQSGCCACFQIQVYSTQHFHLIQSCTIAFKEVFDLHDIVYAVCLVQDVFPTHNGEPPPEACVMPAMPDTGWLQTKSGPQLLKSALRRM